MFGFLQISDVLVDIKNAILSFNGISDILDILLVALIIYAGINLIKDTKAIQLAKGFIFIVLMYIVVTVLKMEVSSYFFTLFFSNLLVVLVVIFSPEIRHALESVGKSSVPFSKLFSLKNGIDYKQKENINKMIDAVSRACSDMSDKKIGALIVFEKETLLGEIINTGTQIDAEITTEIIGNIFFPKAPLHDGAMIIKNSRICAAGCILPLTKYNEISSSLGTRHRAAIGMSEQSDALVVVVSEETGAISVAEKGRLRRNISDGDLREILNKTFELDLSSEKGLFKNSKKGENNNE